MFNSRFSVPQLLFSHISHENFLSIPRSNNLSRFLVYFLILHLQFFLVLQMFLMVPRCLVGWSLGIVTSHVIFHAKYTRAGIRTRDL
jgi:hypothetical protein